MNENRQTSGHKLVYTYIFRSFFTLLWNFLSAFQTEWSTEGGLWKENKLWNCNLQPRETSWWAFLPPHLCTECTDRVYLTDISPQPPCCFRNLQLKSRGAATAALCPGLALCNMTAQRTPNPFFLTLRSCLFISSTFFPINTPPSHPIPFFFSYPPSALCAYECS